MITKISGRVRHVDVDSLNLEVGAIEYEVLIPDLVRRQLASQVDKEVSLFTIEYLEGNPAHGRMTPRIIGFQSEVEREFFDLFCSVDGLGVKKALKSLARPVREIAEAIERGDTTWLASLPGIGNALAERVVAKLRRKVPKFALMVSKDAVPESQIEPNVIEEAFFALQAVGHSALDARRMIDAAAATKKKFKDVQELLFAVYQQSKG